MMKAIRFAWPAMVLFSASAVVSCNDSPPGAAQQEATPKESPFDDQFHIYVQSHGERRRVDLAPSDAPQSGSSRSGGTNAQSTHAAAAGLDPAGDSVKPQGLFDLDLGTTIGNAMAGLSRRNDAWNLLQGAAAECGMIGDKDSVAAAKYLSDTSDARYATLRQFFADSRRVLKQEPLDSPWSTDGSWYIFPEKPQTCDEVLEDEETLVCIADKLAEASDAIAPVTWENVRWLLMARDSQHRDSETNWLLPPQGETSKFIARDLAISVLAHVPMLDSLPIVESADATPFPARSCSALYAVTLPDTAAQARLSARLYGAQPTYPPPPQGDKPIGRARLAFETNTLRASGLLLHDLIRRSVYADMAGASHKFGAALDPQQGNAAMWGFDGLTPYNNVSHAVRVLMGRLEMGVGQDPEQDRRCHDINALSLLQAADDSTKGRVLDSAPINGNELLASKLFERAGLVVAPSYDNSVRPLLEGQLLASVAQARGESATSFAASKNGLAIKGLVADLTDGALATGSARNRAVFSTLTGRPVTNGKQIVAAMSRTGLIRDTAFTGVGASGVAIRGGFPRAALSGDAMAHAGPLMAASQCSETDPGAQTTDELAAVYGPERYFQSGTLQDAFEAGYGIRNRLVKLREVADASASFDRNGPPDARARGSAIAELGAWAGHTKAVLTVTSNLQDGLTLDLFGVEPGDFGVTTLAEVASSLRLVYGEPLDAECAAHLRSDNCDGAAQKAVPWVPESSTVAVVSGAEMRRRYGATGGWISVKFGFFSPATPPELVVPSEDRNPVYAALAAKPFQLVAARDPQLVPGKGAVLGALQFTSAVGFLAAYPGTMASTMIVSPMRKELVEAVLGVGKWIGAAPPRIGDTSLAASPQYCIEGVPRDVFVPLSNELSDESEPYENSWKHYLAVARDAAKRADDLGQQWVDIGFARDQESERAAETLIPKVGEWVDPEDVKVDESGNLVVGASNGALASALGMKKLDLVFLTDDPFKDAADDVARLALLRQTLPCNPVASQLNVTEHPLCASITSQTHLLLVNRDTISKFKGAADRNTIAYTALGLAPAAPPPPVGVTACDKVVDSALSMKNEPGLFAGTPRGTTFSSPVFSGGLDWATDPTAIEGSFRYLRLKVEVTGAWSLTSAGAALMDSELPPAPTNPSDPVVQAAWPSCLRNKSCVWTAPNPDIQVGGVVPSLHAVLTAMFRRCDGADPRTADLGACEGSTDVAELNALRWRVEGALWLAATMNGGVPPGMFNVALPAVNFEGLGPNVCAPINEVYGNGAFHADDPLKPRFGFKPQFGPTLPVSEYDALGAPAVPIDPRFMQWPARVAEEVPGWLRAVYAPATAGTLDRQCIVRNNPDATGQSTRYLHVFGSNVNGPSDFSNLSAFFDQAGLANGVPRERIDTTTLAAISGRINGQQCAAPVGNFPKPSALDLQGLVAAMKTNQSLSGAMRAPFYRDEKTGWYSWATTYWWANGAFGDAPLPDEVPAARSQWFDELRYRYHWYDKGLSSISHYTTDVWFPQTPIQVSEMGTSSFNGSDRLPSVIPPSKRVPAVVNGGAPNGNCGAAWQFTQGVAMACVGSRAYTDLIQITPPPKVESTGDLIVLERWLRYTLRQARQKLGQVYLENIPAPAVSSFLNERVSEGGAKGDVGKSIDEMNASIGDLPKQWGNILAQGELLANGIATTRLAIERADIELKQQHDGLMIQQYSTIKDMAEHVGSFISSLSKSANPYAAVAGAGVSMAAAFTFDGLILDKIGDLKEDANALHSNSINQAFTMVNGRIIEITKVINDSLITIRQDVALIRAKALELESEKNQIAYATGKAAGLGVWNCGSQTEVKECRSSVNTVLNRRYSAAAERYQRALRDAKALAYIARRSIEQRIGIPLSQIATRVGPLDPPAAWADDVCRLTGIDYKRLRTEPGLDAGTTTARNQINSEIASEFADAFIGDYVEKLGNFVEYYNLAYPSHDGTDTVVLSLRESVFRDDTTCRAPARNLLTDSAHLDFLVPVSQGAPISANGWHRHPCDLGATNCLSVVSGGALAAPREVPAQAGTGGVTWLVDRARPALIQGSGGNAASQIDLVNEGVAAGPPGLVSQAVELDVGAYAISWWDQARDLAGAITATPTGQYPVLVLDHNDVPIASRTDVPAANGWGPRRLLKIDIKQRGFYRIAFGASLAGAGPGSVAIANVQVETLAPDGLPTEYQPTDSTGKVDSFTCIMGPEAFRSQFRRWCDGPGNCYYELRKPIDLDTSSFTVNGVSLEGKMAKGNFNYRHTDIAVNLVGTGLRDCSNTPSPDCYASSYLEYTLEHDADDVGVIAYDGQPREFDFGIGTVSRGKALAAERYITVPVSTSDQSLLQQPGILKQELRGRPVEGTYRLRLHETPALQWTRLTDVQLVMQVRYWSRVSTPGQF